VRLHYQAHGHDAESQLGLPEGQWQHTPWGRIAVGVLVAQGLTYGLQMLCTAGLLAASEEPTRTVWATIFGLVLLQGLQALSLLIGSGLTAAGQQRGMFLGCIVGLISGPVFVLVQKLNGEVLTDVALYGQPILALIFGTLGGLLGSSIWKPLPTLRIPGLTGDGTKGRPLNKNRPSILAGPVAWGRVGIAIAVAAAAVLWPRPILDFVVDASQGTLRLQSKLQAELVTWEIAGLLTLLAAAFAGATTRNGLKQGLCVGVGVAVVLVGTHFGSRSAVLDQTILLVFSVLCLTVVGGWFGGQLFPPIPAPRAKIRTVL
jgi:hypothetical protein